MNATEKTEEDVSRSDTPQAVLPEDLGLVALNLGPVVRDDSGVRWTPLGEIVDYPGAFHG